jgi:hypothetical protein
MSDKPTADTTRGITLTAFKMRPKELTSTQRGEKLGKQVKQALKEMDNATIDGFVIFFEPNNMSQYKKIGMMLSRYGRALSVEFQYQRSMAQGELKVLPK